MTPVLAIVLAMVTVLVIVAFAFYLSGTNVQPETPKSGGLVAAIPLILAVL